MKAVVDEKVRRRKDLEKIREHFEKKAGKLQFVNSQEQERLDRKSIEDLVKSISKEQ